MPRRFALKSRTTDLRMAWQVAGELETQVARTEDEAGALRRQLKLKTKELRHIRRLSQMILDQRSEVGG
jgi:hypothetical protein